MEQNLDQLFLEFSVRKLRQLTERIQECLRKLNDEQIWWRAGAEQNSVGNLVLHLSGNVRQWIISSLGGQPDIRVRDREFSARGGETPRELGERLVSTVAEAVPVIESLSARRLTERVTIQRYDVTVLEAVYHVVEHFSQHTGQILLLTKALTGSDLGFYSQLSSPASLGGDQTP